MQPRRPLALFCLLLFFVSVIARSDGERGRPQLALVGLGSPGEEELTLIPIRLKPYHQNPNSPAAKKSRTRLPTGASPRASITTRSRLPTGGSPRRASDTSNLSSTRSAQTESPVRDHLH